MNIEEAKQEFLKYAESYRNISDRCVLKINHTLRVVDLCERIAKSINLPKEDVNLAMLCGLLHDIGRFEQWKNYETFDDSKSIDHAALGIQILMKNNYINKYLKDKELQETLKNSIFYHNKFKIDDSISDRDKIFSKIVRDADKIDILYLYTIGQIKIDTKDECFSEKIYQTLLDKKEIKRGDKNTSSDPLSISLGFAFDINFLESYKILKETDYFNKEIEIYKNTSNNKEFQEQLETIRNMLNQYIGEKIEC